MSGGMRKRRGQLPASSPTTSVPWDGDRPPSVISGGPLYKVTSPVTVTILPFDFSQLELNHATTSGAKAAGNQSNAPLSLSLLEDGKDSVLGSSNYSDIVLGALCHDH